MVTQVNHPTCLPPLDKTIPLLTNSMATTPTTPTMTSIRRMTMQLFRVVVEQVLLLHPEDEDEDQ